MDRRMTLEEIEVEAVRGGPRGRDGGLASANNVCGVIFVSVSVDGASSASHRGMSFGGYEESRTA